MEEKPSSSSSSSLFDRTRIVVNCTGNDTINTVRPCVPLKHVRLVCAPELDEVV